MSACYDVLLHINEGQDAIEKNAVPSHDKPKDVDVCQDSKILHLRCLVCITCHLRARTRILNPCGVKQQRPLASYLTNQL